MLANHVWSFAGDGSRDDVSATFLQPFLSFTTKKQTTFGLNTESVYDWEHEEWIVPLNLFVTQLLRIGKQPVSLSLGPRYYADGVGAALRGDAGLPEVRSGVARATLYALLGADLVDALRADALAAGSWTTRFVNEKLVPRLRDSSLS